MLVLSRKSLCKPASNKMSKHRKISKHELLVIIVPLVGLAPECLPLQIKLLIIRNTTLK